MRLFSIIVILLAIHLRPVILNPDDNDYPDNDDGNLFNNGTWPEYGNAETGTFIITEPELKEKDVVNTEATEAAFNLGENGGREQKASRALDLDECGDPPSVKNAAIMGEKEPRYEVGAKVSYLCENGYFSDGVIKSSECILLENIQTLQWTDPNLHCSPRSCGNPGYVSHAHREGSVFTFPNKVTFECEEGYKIRGYGVRYCQPSGLWSGTLPTCELVFCDQPPSPENGRVSYSSLSYDSALRYECDEGFILRNYENRICLANGTWSGDDPVCQEAQCDPPVAPEFGSVQVIGGKSSVGSRAIYTCEEGRLLIGSEKSKCLDIGEWTFPTPKCLEPCSVPKIAHGKLGKYVRNFYNNKRFEKIPERTRVKDEEELILICEDKYEPLGKPSIEEKIICNLGEWSVYPSCEPAQCRGPPPPTENAEVHTQNKTHGGGVVYHCNRHAKKVQYGNVQCVFGSWRGNTPICKDTRCSLDKQFYPGIQIKGKRIYLNGQSVTPSCERGYETAKENNKLKCIEGVWEGYLPPCKAAGCSVKDIRQSDLLKSDMETIVPAGKYLQVQCDEGFTPSGNQALCSAGKWTIAGNLCKESSCNIYRINNGDFTRSVSKNKWNFWKAAYDYWTEYKLINLGQTRSPGNFIHVSCDVGYTFQGKGSNHVQVKCIKGKWYPEPVCLITGAPYPAEEIMSVNKVIAQNSEMPKPIAATSTATNLTLQVIAEKSSTLNTTPNSLCTCTYQGNDENIVAYAGTDLLQYGTQVKDNCTVKFHCLAFGISRLNGPSEITCSGCRTWHSSEFPQCDDPFEGDALLLFNAGKLLPGGIVGIEKGSSVSFQCISNGVADHPKWVTPDGAHIAAHNMYTQNADGSYNYASMVNISNADSVHSGKYQCYVTGYRPNTFYVQILDPHKVNCPKLEDDDLIIDYDKEQAVNSSAMFHCKDSNKRIFGLSAITCLMNGQWSGNLPECKVICPEVQETEGFAVSYTKNLYEGSIAGFHCLSPRKLYGVRKAVCQGNGEWSDPIPKCELQSCSIESIFQVLPENVVPLMENVTSDSVTFNFSLRLTCEKNLKLSGSDLAKCGKDGLWEISAVQCISGCPHPLQGKVSDLIIEPDQSFYRLGQFIVLSCPPGQIPSSDVVRIMCLRTGWSQTNLPLCESE